METPKNLVIDAGEEVINAVGELSATTTESVKAVTDLNIDHDEVKGWLTTIFKALFAAIK